MLGRAAANPDTIGMKSGSSLVTITIDPVCPGGKDEHITMLCTPLTTGNLIIQHLDPLIKREFPKISFPKKNLALVIEVCQDKKIELLTSIFINGSTLASIGMREGYKLRLKRLAVNAPHRLLVARLNRIKFTPPIGKFDIVIKNGSGAGPEVTLMNVTKETTLSCLRKRLKRTFEAVPNPDFVKRIKRAKKCRIRGAECGEWDHSTTTLEDLRVDKERSKSLVYDFSFF